MLCLVGQFGASEELDGQRRPEEQLFASHLEVFPCITKLYCTILGSSASPSQPCKPPNTFTEPPSFPTPSACSSMPSMWPVRMEVLLAVSVRLVPLDGWVSP